MKIKKGQTIKFAYPSDLAGVPLILTGTVIGHGKEVRQKWPEECGEASDSTLLIKLQDIYGNILYHAVNPEDVEEILPSEEEKEA